MLEIVRFLTGKISTLQFRRRTSMFGNLTNFETCTDAQIAAHASKLDLGETPRDDYPATLLGSIARGRSVIEKRAYGYAIVHPLSLVDVPVDGAPSRRKWTILEILYISPTYRGAGTVDVLLAELKQKYPKWPLYLVCYGEWRRDFFLKHGFVVLTASEQGVFEMGFTRPTD
jgi:hypothetical protein